MQFSYTKCEGEVNAVYRPILPVTLVYKQKKFPITALVDTGADMTILPLAIAHQLEVELDDAECRRVCGAGGGVFTVMPSQKKIGYVLESKGCRPVYWEGVVYFSETESIMLLGHHQCLERLDLTFHGPEKKLDVLPC